MSLAEFALLIKANNSIQTELHVKQFWKGMMKYKQSSSTLNDDIYLVVYRTTHKLSH